MPLLTSINTNLTNEFNGVSRRPAGVVTVQRHFPEWTNVITGLSGNAYEQYAHGHAAAALESAGGAGEDIIIRARSGSYTSPRDGRLYIATIRGSDLDTPANWESLWVDTGISGLMHPAWTADSGAYFGGGIDIAVFYSSTIAYGRVFFLKASGAVSYIDVVLTSGLASSEINIGTVGSGTAQLTAMQLAASSETEVFVLAVAQVEQGYEAWHKPVYGSTVLRYALEIPSGWLLRDSSAQYVTHAEGGLFRDGPDAGDSFTGATAFTTQWGKRVGGGLAASLIDEDRVLVSMGMVFWRRWGYETHSHGIMSFIYHRDCGWWEPGPEISQSDFTRYAWLDVNCLARSFTVDGQNFISWVRLQEPSDFRQVQGSEAMPRIRETVYAKVAPDGQEFSQFLHLGSADDFAGARIVAVAHGGSTTLYALGWRSVARSPAAAFLTSAGAMDISHYLEDVSVSRNNRQGMTLDLGLIDPTPLFDADHPLKAGSLLRFYFGNQSDQLLSGSGFVDVNSPALSVDPSGQFSRSVPLNGRADDLLLNTRAEEVEDILPHTTLHIGPAEEIENISFSRGLWQMAELEWPDLFFPGSYPSLAGVPSWRLMSFPHANTGGADGDGDPGDVLNERSKFKGTWFKDISWLSMPPMVNGMIQASVRFGDVYNQGNFDFETTNGAQTYQTITRASGVITRIDWRTGSYGGPVWNSVAQAACMAGLLFHAPEVGRKYAFVWECDSNFALSSHTDDTWTQETFDRADYSAHGVGANRLYLVLSDFDGDDWINRSVAHTVATGLTPGQPADLRVQIVSGRIRCYYRPYQEGAPQPWRFAFEYRAGRFGAGQFGLVGRGHAGIQWDALTPGAPYLQKLDNYVDFWNIHCSDGVSDQPLEAHLRRYAWRGFTGSQFEALVDEAGPRTLSAGQSYAYSSPVENLCLDFNVEVSNGGEAGVYLRGVNSGSPLNDGIRIGLVASSSSYSATSQLPYYAVKRRYSSGSEVTEAREYAPAPFDIDPDESVPVRVTVQGAVYSIWIAGNYVGHFIDTTALGLYFGLYCAAGSASFSRIYVPELYEIPNSALLEPGQAMSEAIKRVIGKRKIKAIFQPNGNLKFSYYEVPASAPDLASTHIWQAKIQNDSRYLSKVRVEGAGVYAIAQSDELARRGQRFQVISNNEIQQREFAYREAEALLRETAQSQTKGTFTGLPDPRFSPEQATTVNLPAQNATGDFIIEDVSLSLKIGDNPDASMTLSSRQQVAL